MSDEVKEELDELKEEMQYYEERFFKALETAEHKAWESLVYRKFSEFGYWASVWSELNKLDGVIRENPFLDVVKVARRKMGR